jgi:hypothetical protein
MRPSRSRRETNEARRVAGNRERQPLRGHDHRRVDADHFPVDVTSGPPELPGLSAASVCRMSSINRPDRARSDRPSADTTPLVTVA